MLNRIALQYVERETSPFAAYMAMQYELCRRYALRSGRPAAEWCRRRAPHFARHFGWLRETQGPFCVIGGDA